MSYDILVVGSGIGGMESAIKLGDMGYKVLVVEKDSSVGGKMILLSKVFPTLDCASCISTPKMAATVNHPNIDVMTYSEVEQVQRVQNGQFKVRVRRKPTFINQSACTGCRQCEEVCNVAVPDQFNFDLVARRAAYIPFPQAVPKKAVIEKRGSSPCSFTCPAGIKAHGYVALARSGKFDEAFNLVLDSTPLVGSLGRACYAPCEGQCTRGGLEGPVEIRRLKSYIAERHYNAHPQPVTLTTAEPKGRQVAVVGSGPAGLTCAFQLARQGYGVKIFEAASRPGGMLGLAIPAYRLPREVLDRDIQNVTALGVKIATNTRVNNIDSLQEQGFDAVFLATGTPGNARLGVAGENLNGVIGALEFLRRVNLGEDVNLQGQKVVVIGGGNVAMDAARVAARLGAAQVALHYRRSREDMPAHGWEVEAAGVEGVEFHYFSAPVKFNGQDGQLNTVELIRLEPGAPDAGGRPKPVPVQGSEHQVAADLVITAVGLVPQAAGLADGLKLNPDGTVLVNTDTLQTAVPHVFAGGDVVTGPSMIVNAVAQGKKAAFYIDRYLRGEQLAGVNYDDRLPVVDQKEVMGRQQSYSNLPAVGTKNQNGTNMTGQTSAGSVTEPALTEAEARYSAGRCLDCGVCSECSQCITTCPANAVDMAMRERVEEVEAAAVIMSTGFKLFPAELKTQYGYGTLKNVITGMHMDRLLAPTRPYNSVLRPGDGKVPDNIAFVLCTGSRDCTVDNQLCSRVCCMYSVKHNQLIMGALPLADVTVYYMDIRAFSKGYDEFYQQAEAMGANFVRGRIAGIDENQDGNLVLQYEDIANGGQTVTAEHDLVVLSVGMLPNTDAYGIFSGESLQTDDFSFVKEMDEDIDPGRTSIDGVFVAGTASGARDIPDSILHAGAAAAQAAAYVERARVKR